MTCADQAFKKLCLALSKSLFHLHPISIFTPQQEPKMLAQTALFALALAPLAVAQISEGFESGWNQTTWTTYAPDCNQGGKITLDTTTAHTGKNSIRVDGAGGYCGHIFVGTNKVPTGDLYVRTWL